MLAMSFKLPGIIVIFVELMAKLLKRTVRVYCAAVVIWRTISYELVCATRLTPEGLLVAFKLLASCISSSHIDPFDSFKVACMLIFLPA